MIPKRPVKPLELVVSAIQCLSEKKGWSVQKIIKYLGGKYSLDIDRLRPLVCEGIRRGLASGVLTHRSGLFRLNDPVIDTLKKSLVSNREKLRRLLAQARKRMLKRSKNFSHNNCQSRRSPKKLRISKNHKRNLLKQIRKLQEESKQHKKT